MLKIIQIIQWFSKIKLFFQLGKSSFYTYIMLLQKRSLFLCRSSWHVFQCTTCKVQYQWMSDTPSYSLEWDSPNFWLVLYIITCFPRHTSQLLLICISGVVTSLKMCLYCFFGPAPDIYWMCLSDSLLNILKDDRPQLISG